MKTLEVLCPGITPREAGALGVHERNMLALWRVIPEGKAFNGGLLVDTHDEETGECLIAPYRGRHIVDGFGNPICEFVHEDAHARLIAAAPVLMSLVERACAPGCIGEHEFTRPGGWRDQAAEVIAAIAQRP